MRSNLAAPLRNLAETLTPKPKLSQAAMLEIIRRPHVTEKSTMGSEHNQVTFKVPLDAVFQYVDSAAPG